jgi:hypothetical protein
LGQDAWGTFSDMKAAKRRRRGELDALEGEMGGKDWKFMQQ